MLGLREKEISVIVDYIKRRKRRKKNKGPADRPGERGDPGFFMEPAVGIEPTTC
jgi:hypothetical protein